MNYTMLKRICFKFNIENKKTEYKFGLIFRWCSALFVLFTPADFNYAPRNLNSPREKTIYIHKETGEAPAVNSSRVSTGEKKKIVDAEQKK